MDSEHSSDLSTYLSGYRFL